MVSRSCAATFVRSRCRLGHPMCSHGIITAVIGPAIHGPTMFGCPISSRCFACQACAVKAPNSRPDFEGNQKAAQSAAAGTADCDCVNRGHNAIPLFRISGNNAACSLRGAELARPSETKGK